MPESYVNPEAGREPSAGSTADPFPSETNIPAIVEPVEQQPIQDRGSVVPAGQTADWPPPATAPKLATPAQTAEADQGPSSSDPFADKLEGAPKASPYAPKDAPFSEPPHTDPPPPPRDASVWPISEADAVATGGPQGAPAPMNPFPPLETSPDRGSEPQSAQAADASASPGGQSSPSRGNAPGGSIPPSGASEGWQGNHPAAFGATQPGSNPRPSFDGASTPFPPFGAANPPSEQADPAKIGGDPFAAPAGGATAVPGGRGLVPEARHDVGMPHTPSRPAPFATEVSSAPGGLAISQPPVRPLTGFATDAGHAHAAIAPPADQLEGPSGPPAAATPPADKKPWWGLTGALLVLFASLGGNAYLGWMNWDLRRQYTSLLDMFKQQRANKSRA